MLFKCKLWSLIWTFLFCPYRIGVYQINPSWLQNKITPPLTGSFSPYLSKIYTGPFSPYLSKKLNPPWLQNKITPLLTGSFSPHLSKIYVLQINWSSKRLTDLSEATQLVNGQGELWIDCCKSTRIYSFLFPCSISSSPKPLWASLPSLSCCFSITSN